MKQPWKKRQLKRAEKAAVMQLEKELKEAAEKEKEVQYVHVPYSILKMLAALG